MNTENQKKPNSWGLFGAVAGMIAAIVAITATVLGGFVFIDRTYVAKDGEDLVKFERLFQERFNSKMDSYDQEIGVQIAKLKSDNQQLNALLAERNEAAKLTLIELGAYQNEAVSRLSDVERSQGRVPRYHAISGTGPEFAPDEGLVTGRSLTFAKFADSSNLRVMYFDNFRVTGAGKACRWRILIDGRECPSGSISGDFHDQNSGNNHIGSVIGGYCEGLKEGTHIVTVAVQPHPASPSYADSDCYTGWHNNRWSIETMEFTTDKSQ